MVLDTKILAISLVMVLIAMCSVTLVSAVEADVMAVEESGFIPEEGIVSWYDNENSYVAMNSFSVEIMDIDNFKYDGKVPFILNTRSSKVLGENVFTEDIENNNYFYGVNTVVRNTFTPEDILVVNKFFPMTSAIQKETITNEFIDAEDANSDGLDANNNQAIIGLGLKEAKDFAAIKKVVLDKQTALGQLEIQIANENSNMVSEDVEEKSSLFRIREAGRTVGHVPLLIQQLKLNDVNIKEMQDSLVIPELVDSLQIDVNKAIEESLVKEDAVMPIIFAGSPTKIVKSLFNGITINELVDKEYFDFSAMEEIFTSKAVNQYQSLGLYPQMADFTGEVVEVAPVESSALGVSAEITKLVPLRTQSSQAASNSSISEDVLSTNSNLVPRDEKLISQVLPSNMEENISTPIFNSFTLFPEMELSDDYVFISNGNNGGAFKYVGDGDLSINFS